jgi:MFS family permease
VPEPVNAETVRALRPLGRWTVVAVLTLTALIALAWSSWDAQQIGSRLCSPGYNFDIATSQTLSADWWPPETVCRFTLDKGLSPHVAVERRSHWGLYIGGIVGVAAAVAAVISARWAWRKRGGRT